MSPDQFRRYRQVGTYGAYRVVFRAVPGLTTGDGWTLGETGLRLAELVNRSLPPKVRLTPDHFRKGTKWGSWSDGDEARYWVTRGWPNWLAKASNGLLPTPDDAIAKRLPDEERRLLKPLIFAPESVRRVTTELLAGVRDPETHADLCDTLANSIRLSKLIAPELLALLPVFSRFADAAMHAMRGLWSEINHDDIRQAPAVDKLARSSELCDRLDKVRETGGVWLRMRNHSVFPHGHVVTELAQAMRGTKTHIERLRALALHHHKHGGGRRWFREMDGKMVPLVADTGIAASDYRFRLRSLARLAAQCGVARMSHVLVAAERREFESVVPFNSNLDPNDEDGDTL